MKQLLFFILTSYSIACAAQIDEAKSIIKELTDAKMHGRGYVKKGDKIAAKYIKKKFEAIGLQRFENSYYQNFSFPINTQPGVLELRINNALLIPGVDYLIDPSSPSIKGTYDFTILTPKDLLNAELFFSKLNNTAGKILLVNCYNMKHLSKEETTAIREIINYLKYSPEHPALATIVFTSKKLTWSGSTTQSQKASFTVSKQFDLEEIETISVRSKSDFKKKYTSQNCIGFIPGISNDSVVILSAHYDHLGSMGSKTYFPGANDNASGIAMLLQTAYYFSKPANKPKHTLVFIAFGAEEIGLLGSKYFTENPLFPLSKIKFLINLDLAGTGDKGIQVVNGSVFKSQFESLKKINKQHRLLPEVKTRGSACNSDHCYFYQKNIPCFYIYTLGGITAYHDIYDQYETLPLTEFPNYSKLIRLFIKQL